MDTSTGFVWIAVIAFVAFNQWLRQQRRVMVHRERLAALEKGIELPPLEQAERRASWNIERVLLLAGISWISIGVTAFVVIHSVIGQSLMQINNAAELTPVPAGLEWIGLAPIGIGVAHLAAYVAGKKKER